MYMAHMDVLVSVVEFMLCGVNQELVSNIIIPSMGAPNLVGHIAGTFVRHDGNNYVRELSASLEAVKNMLSGVGVKGGGGQGVGGGGL